MNEIYSGEYPFPHWIAYNLFDPELVAKAEVEFGEVGSECWQRFANSREKKLACADPSVMGNATLQLLARMTTLRFGHFLETLTGIDGLRPDLTGGGMHNIEPGGHLDIHADFNWSADLSAWRRLNVLLFLNSDWDMDWGGGLELCDTYGTPRVEVRPEANTLVVFETSDISFHGHPAPLVCPEGRSRRSLAVYMFSDDKPPGASAPHSTLFKEK